MVRIRRKKLKAVLSIVLVVALWIGLVAGLTAILTNKTKSVSSLDFSLGSLDENGVYVKSEKSIYTKQLVECQGLTIEPDFETKGTYQVFYYYENKKLLGSTDIMNAIDGIYEKGDTFPGAKYCRIVITPEPDLEQDSVKDTVSEFKIGFFEVAGYASKYDICVYKDQTMKLENLYRPDSKAYACSFLDTSALIGGNATGNSEKWNDSVPYIDLNENNYKEFKIVVSEKCPPFYCCFVEGNNTLIEPGFSIIDGNGAEKEFFISVPEGADHLLFADYKDNKYISTEDLQVYAMK